MLWEILQNTFYGIKNILLDFTVSNMIGLDSMISSVYTTKTILSGKETRKNIIRKHYSLYSINWINRIIIYNVLYYISEIFNYKILINIFLTILVIPNVQNKIMKMKTIQKINDKISSETIILMQYLSSKYIIDYLKILVGIRIHNYNIFLLINNLNVDVVYEFFQNFIFIWAMMILRSYEMTYYYYKGIKLSYYYKTGYIINKIENKDEARYLIKTMIDNKEWNNICKIENVLPIYNLIYDNYNCDILNIIKYNLIKFCITWFWCEFFIIKIFTNNWLDLFILIIIIQMKSYIENVFRIFMLISTIYQSSNIYYMILSLNITILILCKKYISMIIYDVYFYIKNYDSIKKVIDYYKNIDTVSIN